MLALRDLQTAVREALLAGDGRLAAGLIEGDGLSPEARLEIYAHHVLTTLTAALESTYPVLCRLVDRRFFAYAANRYIRTEPPAGPCLFEYGASFAHFLAAFPACRDWPYLPDVARLEWAMNAALHAPGAAPIEPARLASVPAKHMPRLTFALDPSLSLVGSPWPVDRIWRANQDEDAGSVDLAAGATRLEIRRADDGVTMRALDAATFALRGGLAAGRTLEDASAEAFAADPSFDLARALADLLAERILVDFAVSN